LRPTAVPDPEPAERLDPLAFPHGSEGAASALQLGPGCEPELSQRLIGPVRGKRVLLLGTGTGADAIALGTQGARVIVVESDAERIAEARAATEDAGVKVEFHHSDLADLAFVRGDQVDLAISIYALAAVEDLGRVFRQVHRVLRSDTPLLLSLPHPATLIHTFEGGSPRMDRTYFDPAVAGWQVDDLDGRVEPHRIGDVFTTLVRSNFRVDTLVEPMALESDATSGHWSPLGEWMPLTVVFRARKLGV
jgi:SAM-dependent methyltransferase